MSDLIERLKARTPPAEEPLAPPRSSQAEPPPAPQPVVEATDEDHSQVEEVPRRGFPEGASRLGGLASVAARRRKAEEKAAIEGWDLRHPATRWHMLKLATAHVMRGEIGKANTLNAIARTAIEYAAREIDRREAELDQRAEELLARVAAQYPTLVAEVVPAADGAEPDDPPPVSKG